jgi:hypothetical protein
VSWPALTIGLTGAGYAACEPAPMLVPGLEAEAAHLVKLRKTG